MAYKTIQGQAMSEIVEKKSRFIAHLCHIETEQEALDFLQSIREEHSGARHNVYAYILRTGRTRYSDDGEPPQTSGLPTIEVLDRAELKDVICVTTRYFGGTLLGTGGLVRAYTQAVQSAISAAYVVEMTDCVDIEIEIGYPVYSAIQKQAEILGAKVMFSEFGENVKLGLRLKAQDHEKAELAFIEAASGKIDMKSSDSFEAAF